MNMFSYTLDQIAKMMGPEAELIGLGGQSHLNHVEFDTRQIHDGAATLFVAIKGAFRDGHAFVQAAFQQGVRHFLLSDPQGLPPGAAAILVPDTLAALQQFAAAHRRQFRYPVLAITGSNGKTTVKEWLVSLIGDEFLVAKSPQSYNSQLGVALSLLEMGELHSLAVIEAGISKVGEMAKLEPLIGPEIGILTHMGDAHAEGFADFDQKLEEKLQLFAHCHTLIADGSDPELANKVRQFAKEHKIELVTLAPDGRAQLRNVEHLAQGSKAQLWFDGETFEISLPVSGEAALSNAALAMLAALQIGLKFERISARMASLRPVSMRMEMITDNPEITIINDAYNADLASFKNALSLLATERFHASRLLVLTDIDHQGKAQLQVQREMLDLAVQALGADNLMLVGPVFDEMLADAPWVASYPSTEALLEQFDYERFRNHTVLLKGARRFGLDRLIPYLSQRATATWFKINMNAMSHNLQAFRAKVPKGTQIMAMVKAFAYGSGSWEIAQAAVREGVDQLAVAYTSEGIMLRTRGIRVPIMVMNADPQSIEQLFRFDLVPEVFSVEYLKHYVATGKRLGRSEFPVHIKVDTGMSRLGFVDADIPGLLELLRDEAGIVVRSVLSHLSSADDAQMKAFTEQQVERYLNIFGQIQAVLKEGDKVQRHILNTAGILNYPEYAFDMVRLGIGIYGIAPFEGAAIQLEEIGSLHSVVSQLHDYPAGTPIGYGCSEILQRPSKIATVPIGYADGIRRSLSNGRGKFLVKAAFAPIVGRVCMDMLMLDVTDIEGVEEGDEVVLIGRQGDKQISVNDLADWCGTIAYEILTSISQRVRRVYVRE